MKPTSRIDGPTASTRGRAAPTGLGQTSYELWHYLDLNSAKERVLSETQVTVAADYLFAGQDFANAIAENAVGVVNNNGGDAELQQESLSSEEFFTWQLCVVNSLAPRPDVDALIEQFITKAKRKPFPGVTKEKALSIVFEEIKSSRSKPDNEAVWENQFNPFPSYGHPKVQPVIHWKKVREGDEDGGNGENGENGGGGNGGSGGGPTTVDGIVDQTQQAGLTAPNFVLGAFAFSAAFLLGDIVAGEGSGPSRRR